MNITFKQIEAFYWAAELGTISIAAEWRPSAVNIRCPLAARRATVVHIPMAKLS